MLYQIDDEAGKDLSKFQKLIFDPMYEHKRMIDCQNERIQKLDSSNPEAMKIQQIWNTFYHQILQPIPNIQVLYDQKCALQNWIASHEKDAPGNVHSLSGYFDNSPLVVSAEARPNTGNETIPNVIGIHDINSVQALYQSFASHLKLNGNKAFKEEIRCRIATLLSYAEGRRQVQAILGELQKLPFTLHLNISPGKTSKYEYKNGEVNNPKTKHTIYLSDELVTNIFIDPDTSRKKSQYDDSKNITLFHELQHFLHCLTNNGFSKTTSLAVDFKAYTDAEEARTILGSPNQSFMSENSFRKNLGRLQRFGHILGCDPKSLAIENLRCAIEYNISDDFGWITSTFGSKDLKKELYYQKAKLRRKFKSLDQKIQLAELENKIMACIRDQNQKMTELHHNGFNPQGSSLAYDKILIETQYNIKQFTQSALFLNAHNRENLEGIYAFEQFLHLQQFRAAPTMLPNADSSQTTKNVCQPIPQPVIMPKSSAHESQHLSTSFITPSIDPTISSSQTEDKVCHFTSQTPILPNLSVKEPIKRQRTVVAIPLALGNSLPKNILLRPLNIIANTPTNLPSSDMISPEKLLNNPANTQSPSKRKIETT